MNQRPYRLIATIVALLLSILFCSRATAKLFDLQTDSSGAFNIVATNWDVTIAGTTVHAEVYRDTSPGAPVPLPADGIPIPVMRLMAGQMVTCNFRNTLSDGVVPEGASIHWHGIELDNDSDGTAVTQDAVKNNQTYTYRFIAPRPGVFWFHSHMVPGDTLFAGMYGVLIIQDPCEVGLISTNVLPNTNGTRTLALTDTEFLTAPFTNTAGMTGAVFQAGMVGRVSGGQFQTINKWIEDCALQVSGACSPAADPGRTVLVDGYNPDTTAAVGGPLSMPVQAGQVIRLQLFNEALTRTFYLKLLDANTNMVNLVRIGGQGGLLNNARLEGGHNIKGQPTDSGWETYYDQGAIVLSSGTRSDVVATIPSNATAGQRLTLKGVPFTITNNPWPLTSVNITNPYPVAYFDVIAGAPANNPAPITNGTPILVGHCTTVPSLTNGASNIKTNFMNPPAPFPGTNSGTIRLTQSTGATNKPSIDNLALAGQNGLDGNDGNGSVWSRKPHYATDRYAHVGDLYVLKVRNETGSGNGSPTLSHPFHLHGWSLQPLAMVDNASGNALYTFPYNEFLDTIEVYATQTLVFSVRLDDHQTFCDRSSGTPPAPGPILGPCTGGTNGGALGTWLYHCHIAAHGVLGMMGQILVIDDTPQQVALSKPPDTTTNGVDVLATKGTGSVTVADDFRTNGPFTGITIWGSWTNNLVDPNAAFELKFWTDTPANNSTPSRPGWQAWRQMFPAGTYTSTLVASNINFETFYDPSHNTRGTDSQVYRYDFSIPQSAAFTPFPGFTNWLSVTAYTSTNTYFFGWKSCPTNFHYNDDATWSPTLIGPHWSDLHYPAGPYAPASMDMAFQLSVPAVQRGLFAPLPIPVLTATLADGGIRISWDGGGTLQYADDWTGPWYDIAGASSPYAAPLVVPQRFYRVHVP